MNAVLIVSTIALWVVVLAVSFLLLGTLRSLGLLQWQVEQLKATQPSRINRGGLKPGKKAPEFTLPVANGVESSLSDYVGRRVLLVFVQAGCEPCHKIAPELNRLQRNGDMQVLVINRAEPDEVLQWAAEVHAAFPVLVQDGLEVSKKYEVFATPFAFVIDEEGVIASSGIVNSRQHIGFVLDAAERRADPKTSSSGQEDAADRDSRLTPVEETRETMKIADV